MLCVQYAHTCKHNRLVVVENVLVQVSDNMLVSEHVYEGASSNLSSTPECFPVDGIDNLTSRVELRRFTYICELPVRRLCPSEGACLCSYVSFVSSLQELKQFRPSFGCADTDGVFCSGLVTYPLIAVGYVPASHITLSSAS